MLCHKDILVNHGKTQFGRVEYDIVGIALISTSAEPEKNFFQGPTTVIRCVDLDDYRINWKRILSWFSLRTVAASLIHIRKQSEI